MENDIKFYLNFSSTDSASFKVDVMGANLPDNLFGVSFHLKINGPDWSLSSYDPGNVFNGVDPVIMVQEKHAQVNEVIAGITMKRGDNYQVNDGVLTSFYIEPKDFGSFKMDFENATVVAYEDGRVDLNNVVWSGKEVYLNVNDFNETELVEVDPKKEFAEDSFDNDFAAYSLVDNGQSNALKIMKNDQHSIWDVYLVLIVSFFVLTFGYMFYLWFIGKRNKS